METAFSSGSDNMRWISLFFLATGLFASDIVEDLLKYNALRLTHSVYGWCSDEKALAFVDLVLDVKPDVCVEIGVSGGASLFPVALALKSLGKGIAIGIDPWDNVESARGYDPETEAADYGFWSTVDVRGMLRSFCDGVRDYRLSGHCLPIVSTSERAAALIDQIDILYIDGDHSEEGSALDVELYLPKVRAGGYIWMNDVIWEQRQLAMDMLEETCDFVKCIDDGNCVLFQKRGESYTNTGKSIHQVVQKHELHFNDRFETHIIEYE
jgi:cephalosporin hydroxylase